MQKYMEYQLLLYSKPNKPEMLQLRRQACSSTEILRNSEQGRQVSTMMMIDELTYLKAVADKLEAG